MCVFFAVVWTGLNGIVIFCSRVHLDWIGLSVYCFTMVVKYVLATSVCAFVTQPSHDTRSYIGYIEYSTHLSNLSQKAVPITRPECARLLPILLLITLMIIIVIVILLLRINWFKKNNTSIDKTNYNWIVDPYMTRDNSQTGTRRFFEMRFQSIPSILHKRTNRILNPQCFVRPLHQCNLKLCARIFVHTFYDVRQIKLEPWPWPPMQNSIIDWSLAIQTIIEPNLYRDNCTEHLHRTRRRC